MLRLPTTLQLKAIVAAIRCRWTRRLAGLLNRRDTKKQTIHLSMWDLSQNSIAVLALGHVRLDAPDVAWLLMTPFYRSMEFAQLLDSALSLTSGPSGA